MHIIRKIDIILFITALLLASLLDSTISAQDKKWEVDLKDQLYNVSWILQSNDGLIIAAGDKGLLALNNETGETVWHHNEFKAINKGSYLNIEGLPLFYVDYESLVGRTRGVIINSSTGDVVFDTKDEGYRIKAFNIYPGQAAIMFEAYMGPEQYLMKFSLKTWTQEWLANVGKAKGLLGKTKAALSSKSFVSHGPYFTNKGQMIIGKKEEIIALNFETGKVAWQQETKKKIKALVYSKLNDKIYVGVRKSKKLLVLDPASGQDVTPGKLKLRGSLLDVTSDANNNLVLVETEGFNLIDPKTETFVWKKSFKIENLDEVIPYGDKFIAIGKHEKDGSIALVNREGKKIWDEKIKGYAYYATPSQKGVLYISTERANILGYEKGKDIWKKDVKFKSIPAVTYDDKEGRVVIFENKKGYKFDLSTGDIELFAEDIKLENVNKKTPLTAQYVVGGYFINSAQHASLLSPSGQIKYSKYFEPVKSVGGLLRLAELSGSAALGVDLDIQGSMDNISILNSLSKGSFQSAGDQNDGEISSSVLAGLYTKTNSTASWNTVFEVTEKRHSNSKMTKNHQYIVTKNESQNKAFIYQLNKSTGSIDKQIELVDKSPDYVIDIVDNRVFLNERNQLITCYQL